MLCFGDSVKLPSQCDGMVLIHRVDEVFVVTKVMVLLFILGMAHPVMWLLGLINQSLAQLVPFLVESSMPVDVLDKVL
jgi:hypothetical protein